jgi:Ca2+-binding EF-hand superfamily protein
MFEMDSFVSSEDLQLLMNRFDKNREGRVSFKNVSYFLLISYSLKQN